MEVIVQMTDDEGNKTNVKINKTKFHKMVFLFNVLEEGWSVKKKEHSYYLLKNHEGKKEILHESYLSTFMKDTFDINKLLS
jgi:hypothetical protein